MPRGGARPGAGRKPGGVNEAARIIKNGLKQAFVIVGKQDGLSGDDEAICTQAIATIGAQMIRAGRGDEVLKIMVVNSKTNDLDDSSEGLSCVQQALSALPGVARSAPKVIDVKPSPEKTSTYNPRASDYKSDAAIQAAQSLVGGQGTLLPVITPEVPPHPPSRGPHTPNMVDTKNSEKIFSGDRRGSE